MPRRPTQPHHNGQETIEPTTLSPCPSKPTIKLYLTNATSYDIKYTPTPSDDNELEPPPSDVMPSPSANCQSAPCLPMRAEEGVVTFLPPSSYTKWPGGHDDDTSCRGRSGASCPRVADTVRGPRLVQGWEYNNIHLCFTHAIKQEYGAGIYDNILADEIGNLMQQLFASWIHYKMG